METTTRIQKLMEEMGSIENVKNELKKVQSLKCRLKKQRGRSDYTTEMDRILNYENDLKDVRNLMDPREKPITKYTQEDVDRLDYDQTIKGIKSIQSKKTLTRWLTDVEGDNEEFKNACIIETMLIEHRNKIKPLDPDHVRKSDIITIIDTIESSGTLSQEKIVELLRTLV